MDQYARRIISSRKKSYAASLEERSKNKPMALNQIKDFILVRCDEDKFSIAVAFSDLSTLPDIADMAYIPDTDHLCFSAKEIYRLVAMLKHSSFTLKAFAAFTLF